MDHITQVSVDEWGRIVIPAALNEQRQLTPGTTLVVEKGNQGDVRLHIQSRLTVLVEKGGLLVARVTAAGNLADVMRHERDQRVFGLLQRAGL